MSGDTAQINSGTVLASGLTLSGLTIALSSGSTADQLTLADDTIGADTTIQISNPNAYSSANRPTIGIQGTTVNNGTITLAAPSGINGNVTVFDFSPASGVTSGTLINRGTITLAGSSIVTRTASGASAYTIENDNTITLTNTSTGFQSTSIGAQITGTGTINIGTYGGLDLSQSVGAGQTVNFSAGYNGQGTLQIEQPTNFKATISNFVAGNTIDVTGVTFTSANYTDNGNGTGTLHLLNGSTDVGDLTFKGVYNSSNFSFNSSSPNLFITTNVTNAATGSTTPPTTQPVYRFFDRNTGTQLLTADVNERNNVINTLANRYTEETNNFGAVSPTDSGVTPVYRFFDTVFGTHFFTSSTSERDGLETAGSSTYRPDLTYEGGSTFYEHSTQQTGDVAVHRFFEKGNGTHFYTGDNSEYVGLTTPGASTYRADLVDEGVAFYAPAGSFL